MQQRNFLFVSADASLIGDIAWQVQKEGHPVRYFIEQPGDKEVAHGFVTKTDDWRADVDWADVIVFDDIWIGDEIATGKIAEELRAQGKAVIGGSPATDKLEDDRGYAMDVLEKHGIHTVRHRVFTDFDEAIAHVEKEKAAYVIKPLGEVQNVKRLLYVGHRPDGSDVVDVLRAYKKAWGHRMKGFQLQKKVQGVEVAICGFFNGTKFLEPINFNFEHKKLFNNNIGPSTGEMGTSMFWAGRNRLFQKTLGKLEGWLAEVGYRGSIDLNCIVNSQGIYPLEFTPRFGYPTIMLQAEGLTTPISDVLYACAAGEDLTMKAHRGFQIGVRICVPPFPFKDPATFDENSRNAAIVFQDGKHDGIHIQDAKCVDGQWRVASESGVVVLATGKGTTMQEARTQAYKRVQNIIIPNMYYRTDIGQRWIDGEGDKLLAWGYLGPA